MYSYDKEYLASNPELLRKELHLAKIFKDKGDDSDNYWTDRVQMIETLIEINDKLKELDQ